MMRAWLNGFVATAVSVAVLFHFSTRSSAAIVRAETTLASRITADIFRIDRPTPVSTRLIPEVMTLSPYSECVEGPRLEEGEFGARHDYRRSGQFVARPSKRRLLGERWPLVVASEPG